MSGRIAFPHLTLSDASVEASCWMVSLNGNTPEAAGDYLPHWDSASAITLHRDVRVNMQVAMKDLAVTGGNLALVLRVRVGTGPGRLPRRLVKVEYWECSTTSDVTRISLEVPGDDLSTVLDIFTEIIVASSPSGGSDLTPANAGDRIWQERLRVRIEGEEPRFPIEMADFRSLLGDVPAADSPWYLHWSPKDWSRDFHGAIRLFLNKNNEELVARIEAQDGPSLQALLADVMSQVCERFVSEHEVLEVENSYESGMLGAQAINWLGHAWPERDLGFIRSLLQNRPGEFRSAFLALAETRET